MVVNVSGRRFMVFHSAKVGAQKNENDIDTCKSEYQNKR